MSKRLGLSQDGAAKLRRMIPKIVALGRRHMSCDP